MRIYDKNNNLIMDMEQINKIYFFANGEILGMTDRNHLQENKVTNGKINSVYDGKPTDIYFNGDIKKAIKLNLNRCDNFYIKNPEKKYTFDPAYDLYINAEMLPGFENIGEILASDFNHEKNYMTTYKITLRKASFRRYKCEKINCDNYELEPGEKWSETAGPDAQHKSVDLYDNSENPIRIKRNEPITKGIIKRWYEVETVSNCEMLITAPYYTTCVKDEYRKKCEAKAEQFNAVLHNSHMSYYDIERLVEAGAITL